MGVDMLIMPATNANQMQSAADHLMQAIAIIYRKSSS